MTWSVNAEEALRNWDQPDKAIRKEITRWIATMAHWGPPPAKRLRPNRPTFIARYELTNTLILFQVGRYHPDHLYEGWIRVRKII